MRCTTALEVLSSRVFAENSEVPDVLAVCPDPPVLTAGVTELQASGKPCWGAPI